MSFARSAKRSAASLAGNLASKNASTSSATLSSARTYATVSANKPHHKVVIVGGGTAGISAAAQLRKHSQAGSWLGKDDIAIIEPAQEHHYQVGQIYLGRRSSTELTIFVCSPDGPLSALV
jgi:sulfide:quinone oxidoreductase